MSYFRGRRADGTGYRRLGIFHATRKIYRHAH